MTNLKVEISQNAEFSSLEEEAFLNILRTSDCLLRSFQKKTRGWGLTSTQYNVLRILRGAQPNGLHCAAIGARMIAAEPDITRILGRLKNLRLIRQRRDKLDHRIVWTRITDTGLQMLQDMDPVMHNAPKELFGHIGTANLKEMIRLIELARQACNNSKPRS